MGQTKILVVEDDVYYADIYRIELVKIGCEVVVAANGKEAVDLVKKHKPKLVILDLILPVMDGFETLQIIKEDNELSSIRVMVVSNLEQPEDIQRARKLGADEYMVKIENTIKDVVNRARELIESE